MGSKGFYLPYMFKVSPDGRLNARGDDQVIKVFDLASHKTLYELESYGDEVTAMAFSPSGRVLVSGSTDCAAVGSEERERSGGADLTWERGIRDCHTGSLLSRLEKSRERSVLCDRRPAASLRAVRGEAQQARHRAGATRRGLFRQHPEIAVGL